MIQPRSLQWASALIRSSTYWRIQYPCLIGLSGIPSLVLLWGVCSCNWLITYLLTGCSCYCNWTPQISKSKCESTMMTVNNSDVSQYIRRTQHLIKLCEVITGPSVWGMSPLTTVKVAYWLVDVLIISLNVGLQRCTCVVVIRNLIVSVVDGEHKVTKLSWWSSSDKLSHLLHTWLLTVWCWWALIHI